MVGMILLMHVEFDVAVNQVALTGPSEKLEKTALQNGFLSYNWFEKARLREGLVCQKLFQD
jgi:hypothetical protein